MYTSVVRFLFILYLCMTLVDCIYLQLKVFMKQVSVIVFLMRVYMYV